MFVHKCDVGAVIHQYFGYYKCRFAYRQLKGQYDYLIVINFRGI